MADEPNKVRAEIRARQAEDGKKAMAEYEASAAATRAKTEKLRALRLARDAAEQAAPKPPVKPKAKAGATRTGATKSGTAKSGAAKTAKKKKAPAGTLSDWIEGQTS